MEIPQIDQTLRDLSTILHSRTMMRIFWLIMWILVTLLILWDAGVLYTSKNGMLGEDTMAAHFFFSVPVGLLAGTGAVAVFSVVSFLVVRWFNVHPRCVPNILQAEEDEEEKTPLHDDMELGNVAEKTVPEDKKRVAFADSKEVILL
ncbi:MAG: hypothetical protein Q9219_001612 [cf. Caloplaca sp. 3 TL-2023]